jgi:hypothetical protein
MKDGGRAGEGFLELPFSICFQHFDYYQLITNLQPFQKIIRRFRQNG